MASEVFWRGGWSRARPRVEQEPLATTPSPHAYISLMRCPGAAQSYDDCSQPGQQLANLLVRPQKQLTASWGLLRANSTCELISHSSNSDCCSGDNPATSARVLVGRLKCHSLRISGQRFSGQRFADALGSLCLLSYYIVSLRFTHPIIYRTMCICGVPGRTKVYRMQPWKYCYKNSLPFRNRRLPSSFTSATSDV